MMIQSRAPSYSGQDDLLRQPMPAPNIARPRLDELGEEVEEIEYLESSVVIDMDKIRSELHPLCSNHGPLTAINTQPLPGVLSFSQVRNLEQAMASDLPSEEVRASKDFKLQNVGTEAQYGLFKWCKIFGVMTQGRSRDGVHVPPAPKYVDAVRGAFTVETHDSEGPT